MTVRKAPCGPCAARKAALAAQSELVFVWTDGKREIEYPTELIAKAKVMRVGGTYTTKQKTP